MLDIMFYEAFEEEEKALRLFMPEDIKAVYTKATVQEHEQSEVLAKLISVRTQSKIPLSWGDEISGILTRSQGFDHVQLYCRELGKKITCGYLGEYCSRAVAEHAILSMLFLMRKGHQQIRQFNTFDRDGLTGAECFQKKALVIGVGRIGSQIVDMAMGLQMEVKGVDINPQGNNPPYVSLEEGIPWADVIFCALSLTDQTMALLDHALLSKAKNNVVLINISRGEITPLKDLVRLMDGGKLGALGLDVYEQEKHLSTALRSGETSDVDAYPDLMHLKKRDNVLLTPHNAFNTAEALKRKALLSTESVMMFMDKGQFMFPVPE